MSELTTRTLGWPLEPKTAPKIAELVEHLAGEMEAAMPKSGSGCALIEVGADEEGGVLRLAERLAAAWSARGRASVVVDAHPIAPFAADCFEEGAEGFTEILHYGLSPEAAAREREGATGLWIPAGGRWSLPLESPDEPALTLYRLGNLAARVLLLVDAEDAEGLLPRLREHCQYRLVLVPPSAPADAIPAGLGTDTTIEAETAATDELESAPALEESEAETVFATMGGDPEGSSPRGRRLWLLLPLLMMVAALALWGLRGGFPRLGGETELAGGEAKPGFTPLPGPVDTPFHGGQPEPGAAAGEATLPEEMPGAVSEENVAESVPAPALPEPEPEEAPAGNQSAELASPLPADARPAREMRRRFETRARWDALLAHSGDFFVHVESYRDPELAKLNARQRGFAVAGFVLEPSVVDGTIYHRLLVGPFADLSGAAAYRDSLLDRTEETYCTVARGDTR